MTKAKEHTNCKVIFGSGRISKDKYDIIIIRKSKDKKTKIQTWK